MRQSIMRNDGRRRFVGRRIAAAFGGGTLVVSSTYMLYQGCVRMYYDYYFFAQVKEHYIAPPTRYRLMDATFLVGMSLALYVAYRLLKYSFAIAASPASDR
jgi:hypothetical protein